VAVVAGAVVALAAANPGAKQLPGVWVTTVTGRKPAALNGDWTMQILASGDYTIVKRAGNAARLMVKGAAYLVGIRGVVFKNESGPAACTGKQAAGRYNFIVTGKTLTFSRVRDLCIGRRTVLGGTFTKAK
jgi:hypothetical protein